MATVLSLGEDEEIEDLGADSGTTTTSIRRVFNLTGRETELRAARQPIAQLANGVGVLLVVFTDDGKILLTRRRTSSRARPNERDVSVVEGIHTEKDAISTNEIDIYLTAIRGCREELGLEVSPENVCILAFGVDMRYYQWSFLGLVEAGRTAQEVLDLHDLHAIDRWEGRIEPVDADPRRVFERIEQDEIWDLGLVAVYLALCHRYGVSRVHRAATAFFGRRS
ncbi:NUDIX domain-containing protein [Actinomadura fibrosa]|uniref:NUDIX domain-containing protein n=1 Tax=Actinomadura fibrosa TaxID=111802 RepID=A0ABW2Y0T2_9ACTN|nr:NUDIX domain-containing protein [Actinomadura fibrosa]